MRLKLEHDEYNSVVSSGNAKTGRTRKARVSQSMSGALVAHIAIPSTKTCKTHKQYV